MVVLLSGGMDSATLLWEMFDARNGKVRALTVHYGQRHFREIDAARALARRLEVPHQIIDLASIAVLLKGSSQTDLSIAVPHGHYTDESMKLTVVPNRNMILLSVAAAWSISEGTHEVAYAAHAGDHAIYPDCRPEFADALEGALALADWKPVRLIRPFVHLTKADICERGAALRVPFDLTYSCYEGGEEHCGVCGTCVERREAFAVAEVPDPTRYAHSPRLI